MTTHIATSHITGRIHQGQVSKDRRSFVGEKKDVTSQVLQALIEKAEFHGGSFKIEGGGQKWAVKVTKEQP